MWEKMGKNNKDDDYVYSYVQRKMINENKQSFGYKNRRGIFIKLFIFVVAILVGVYFKDEIGSLLSKAKIDESKDFEAPNNGPISGIDNKNSEVEKVKELLSNAKLSIGKEKELISYCTDKYNVSDFSNGTKVEIQRRIDEVKKTKFDTYDEGKYGEFIRYLNNLSDNSIRYGEFIIGIGVNSEDNTKVAREFVNKFNSDINSYMDKLIEMLKKNNFQYKVGEDNTVTYWK